MQLQVEPLAHNWGYKMAQRMRLVEDEEYKRLLKRHTPLSQVKEHFFRDASGRADQVLDNSEIPDDIKIQLYGSIMKSVKQQLNQILADPIKVKLSLDKPDAAINADSSADFSSLDHFSSAISSPNSTLNQSFASSKGSATAWDPDTLNEVPQSSPLNLDDIILLRNEPANVKATKLIPLMTMLKSRPDLIKWDTNGRVTFFGTEFAPETNIIDLVNYVTRELKWSHNPAGINRMLTVCKMVNVPTTMLSKDVKQDLMGPLEGIRIRSNQTDSASRMGGFKKWKPISSKDNLNSNSDSARSSRDTHGPTPMRNVDSGAKRKRRRNQNASTSFGTPNL